MWRKVTIFSFKVIFLYLPGKPPGFSIIDPRFQNRYLWNTK
jgi:hypothetical protein